MEERAHSFVTASLVAIACGAVTLGAACDGSTAPASPSSSSSKPTSPSAPVSDPRPNVSGVSSTAAGAPPAPTGLAPPPAADSASPSVFPLVPGTLVTFRGKTRAGDDDTWTAKLVPIGGDIFQYSPHHDIANWFTKAGLMVNANGILIAGESLDGSRPEPKLAIAFPFKKGAANEVPGLFPCVYTVIGEEKVQVPAGKFDTWKIGLKDKVNPEGAAWIAPGTGIVKIQLPTGRIDELVSIRPPTR